MVRLLHFLNIVLLFCASQLFAGPPFFTDDPAPVEYKQSEFYIFSTYDGTKDGKSIGFPAFEYNYGVLPDMQLHIVAPLVFDAPSGMPTMYGIGDVELGVKYRFIQETEYMPQIGTFPMAELPTGDASRGLGNGQTWWRLPIWIQKSWDEWTSFAGGGYVINHAEGEKDYSFGGWELQKDLSEKWTLGGEIFAREKDTVDGAATALLNFGGFYKFSPDFNLLFSAGNSISGENHTVGYLGLWWSFGDDEPVAATNKPTWSMTQTAR